MEAGSSRSGGMPQVRCSASASQNVPGVRYLQRPRSQGRQVCGSGQVNSFVSSREGSIASLPLLLSGSFICFYGRCCTPRRRPIDKAASLVKYTMHMVFLLGAGDEARLATGIPRMVEPFAGALPDLLIQRASRRSRRRVQACPRHSKKKTPS